jgi:hypothetical protein
MIVGAVLLVVGFAALIAQVTPEFARYVPLAIGLVLLAIFAGTRAYAVLVLGSIFTGMGGGLVAAELLAVTDDPEPRRCWLAGQRFRGAARRADDPRWRRRGADRSGLRANEGVSPGLSERGCAMPT